MLRSLRLQRLAAVLLGTMLAALPAAAGMSLCLYGDPVECCDEPGGAPEAPAGNASTLDGSACDCCFIVDALPFDRGGSAQKGSLTFALVPLHVMVVSSPASVRTTDALSRLGHDSRLPALRSVVLLV